MLLFCIGIVHTNLYKCLSSGHNVIFRTISYCIPRMWLTPGRASVVNKYVPILFINTLGKECYEVEVQPYRKADFKPMLGVRLHYFTIYLSIYIICCIC